MTRSALVLLIPALLLAVGCDDEDESPSPT